MSVKGTEDIRGLVDGQAFLKGSPFHSGYFLIASAIGFISVTIDVYLIIRYWKTLNAYVAIVLGVLIGVQLAYQWWRALRYYSHIRDLYSRRSEDEAKEGTSLDAALRVAAGGLTDILFYCYGMNLVTLILIGAIFKHLEGVKCLCK